MRANTYSCINMNPRISRDVCFAQDEWGVLIM